jgi:hypothetical protein
MPPQVAWLASPQANDRRILLRAPQALTISRVDAVLTGGTTSVFDSWANSDAMNKASHPAAQFCRTLTIGGYDDWYLPATQEWDILYRSFKPEATIPSSTGPRPRWPAAPPTNA